jgi:hypothetical protein
MKIMKLLATMVAVMFASMFVASYFNVERI